MELDSKDTVEKGQSEKSEDNNNKKKKGGLRTMPFILANEMCDRFASTGSHINLITYLTQVLNMPLVEASNTLSNFGAATSFFPLIGALIADSFAGRFWTITVASLIYELGLISLTLSALLPSLRPPPCPTQVNCKEASFMQLLPLYISFLLTAIGSGGIRPCVVTFAADQIDMTKSKVESRSWNFFNWYSFAMGLASLTAMSVVVYIQDDVNWGWGLGIPTIAMVVSIVTFVLGSPIYRKLKPGGSPLTRLAQVVVAAVRKRKIVVPEDSKLLYDNKKLDADISVHGRLVHTDQFKWFDKAAVLDQKDKVDAPKSWRVATVHRVEELKCIIRMLPIWAAGILQVTASSHTHSFTVMQARSMDRHLSHSFQIPPASLSIFGVLINLIGLVLYDRIFVPIARRFTRNPSGITVLQRMGVGYAISVLGTMVSSIVEIKRKEVAASYNLLDKPTATIPISVFWLVPQFCLHGIASVFSSVGHLEFLYDQTPESMRSTAAALYWLTTSLGNYIGILMVTLVHNYTGKDTNWLPDRNINRGRLEYYFWLAGGIEFINLIYYVTCAWFYKYKPLEEVIEHSKDEDVESSEDHRISSKMLAGSNGITEVELPRKEKLSHY